MSQAHILSNEGPTQIYCREFSVDYLLYSGSLTNQTCFSPKPALSVIAMPASQYSPFFSFFFTFFKLYYIFSHNNQIVSLVE